jgi:hypothetical protein
MPDPHPGQPVTHVLDLPSRHALVVHPDTTAV